MILKPGIRLQSPLYFVPGIAQWIVYYVHKMEQVLAVRVERAFLVVRGIPWEVKTQILTFAHIRYIGHMTHISPASFLVSQSMIHFM